MRSSRATVRSLLAVLAAVAVLSGLGVASPVASPATAAPAPRTFSAPVDPLAGYVGQSTCDPTAKPGALALRALVQASYPSVRDGGIVRACHLGGRSEHKEGRAWDWMLNAHDPTEHARAHDFLNWLLATDAQGNRWANARRLGVMYVIWNRQMWASYDATPTWRAYTGPNPHTDHIHISLSWNGALQRTSFWGGAVSGPAPAPVPPPVPVPAPVVYTGPPPPVRTTENSCPAEVVPAAGFADTAGSAHAGSIDCAAWWRIAGGTSATTYAPAARVSRAQMATFLARTITGSGGWLPTSPRDAFADDEQTGPHEHAINQLAAVGIAGGTGSGAYSPGGTVTRAQMATFLDRAWRHRTSRGLKGGQDYFGDVAGDTHRESIGKIARAGFAGGVAPGRYAPGEATNRAQMATFLARFLDLLVESGQAELAGGAPSAPAPEPPPAPVPDEEEADKDEDNESEHAERIGKGPRWKR
jgi:hypothetical protein